MQQGMLERIWRESLKNYGVDLLLKLAAILAISYILSDDRSRFLMQWSAGALVLTLLGFLQYLRAARRYRQSWTFIFADKFYLCLGLMASGACWSVLGWWGIAHYQGPQQFAILVILYSLAGAATATLASLKIAGKAYILLLLLPACVQLFLSGIPSCVTLSVLGGIFAWVMVVNHHNNYKLIRRSVRLALSNQALLGEVSSLADELQSENDSLEARVEERSKDLLRLAYHDELTGLLNRHGVSNLVKYFGITPGNVTVFLISIDKFRQINDGMGHEAGDEVLCQVAQRLESLASSLNQDIFGNVDCQVGRWGGDEFIFYFSRQEEASLLPGEVGDLLSGAINQKMLVAGKNITVDVSIGAVSEQDCDNPNNLFLYADIAAGEAKRTGTVVFFNPGIREQLKRKSMLAQDLRLAIQNDQLYIVTQQLVSADDHKVVSCEVLLRWQHPELGAISPVEFIPVAEESGTIVELGDWVLREAIAAYPALQQGSGAAQLKMAVNVSLYQLLQQDFIDKLLLATSGGFAAENLVIELTESVFHENEIELVKNVLFRIKSLGIKIHIDDFGTGYSSFSRICQLPIDAIKIDKAFIQSADEKNIAIIEAVVLIARRLKIRVIAEGIESLEQAEKMRALGVDELQGFYFSKPTALAAGN